MSHLTAPLLVALVFQVSFLVNAAPDHYGPGLISGGFSGGISADFGGIAHGIRSFGQQINNHFSRVAGAIGDLSGGFQATFQKNYHNPNVNYQTRYVKVRTPVVYEVEKKVYHSPEPSSFSGGFSAAYDKNINIRAPEVSYRPRYVKVEKPADYHDRVDEAPHKTGGFEVKFEKEISVKAPEVHHDVRYMETHKPVEYYEEEEVEIPHKSVGFSGGFEVNVEKNIGSKYHEAKPEIKYKEVIEPVEYQKEVVEVPDKTAQLSGAFEASIGKEINLKAPELKHETSIVKVEVPDKYHEEEVANLFRKTAGFSAGFSIGETLNKENPHVDHEAAHHEEVTHVEHIEPKKVDKRADFSGGFEADIDVRRRVPSVVERHEEKVHENEHEPYEKGFGLVASGGVDVKVDKHHTNVAVKKVDKHFEDEEHGTEFGVEVVKEYAPVKSASVNVDVRKPFTTSHHDKHSDGEYDNVKSVHGLVTVEAPFTSVGVRKDAYGSVDVGVRAPFTQVATSEDKDNKEVSVIAPFTSVHTVKAGANKAVHVRAPFVDVQTGHQGAVRVRAPFVDVITGPKNAQGKASVQIKLPFFNLHL